MAAMTNTQEIQPDADQSTGSTGYERSLKFAGNSDFQAEVRRRVDEFFRSTGQRQRDCPQMYVKTAILLCCFIATYALLVFFAQTWWQALPLAIVLGLVTGAIGFNVQHDGSHHAYSNHEWVNKIMAMTLDLIGGSSHHWHWKHVVFHHTYLEACGADVSGVWGEIQRTRIHMVGFGIALPLVATDGHGGHGRVSL